MNQTISACLVVYNEEKVIRRCLQSIEDVVDEIVVVHDGPCLDETLNICADYTDKIFVRPRIGEAEPHRVFSFQMASGDWILQMDADEILSGEARANLRDLVEDKGVDLYYFLRPFTDGYRSLTLDLQYPWWPCLARKEKMFFIGFFHQQIQTSGKAKRVPFEILHRPGYDNYTWSRFRKKWLRWASIQAEWAWQSPDDIPRFGDVSDDDVIRVLERYRCKSILEIPKVFLRHLGYHLYKGIWRIGVTGVRIALLRAAYEAAVLYHSHKYHNHVFDKKVADRRHNIGRD